ncbi:MAG: TetR/AcrR family transcriptional regulator [Butyrivibrio sp.]
MGTKGDATKDRIINVSQKLFVEIGFGTVTMQDICREAEISRGGLYRYFGSTEEIFAEIIEREQKNAFAYLNRGREANVSAKKMFEIFLTDRIRALTAPNVAFDNEVSEFAAKSELGKRILVNRAESSIEVLSGLIEKGIAEGEFHCDNAKATATHILWLLEGMGKHNALIAVTDEEIDEQMGLVAGLLGTKELKYR